VADVPTLTATPTPSATATDVLTETATDAPTSTATPEPSPTTTAAPTDIPTVAPTKIVTETGIATVSPEPSATVTGTSEGGTQIAAVITVTSIPPTTVLIDPTPTAPTSDEQGGGLAAEAIAAGVILLAIVAYLIAYLRGIGGAKRYANGFIIETCPICHEGHLTVESRTERNLGIPSTRHLVKCDNCRSLLREMGGGRWRYAVDRTVNPVLYDRLNNREIREDTLQRLLDTPPESPVTNIPPGFVDDESDK